MNDHSENLGLHTRHRCSTKRKLVALVVGVALCAVVFAGGYRVGLRHHHRLVFDEGRRQFMEFLSIAKDMGIVSIDHQRMDEIVAGRLDEAQETESPVLTVLQAHLPEVTWEIGSLTYADLNDDGLKDAACLGRTETCFVVAVVLAPVAAKIKPSSIWLLNHLADDFQDSVREPNPRLSIESIDYDPTDAVGEIPHGFKRSKTASRLILSSGETDAFHIFWNHSANALNWWRL